MKRDSEALKSIYKSITEREDFAPNLNLTAKMLTNYLEKRYPSSMVSKIIYYLDFDTLKGFEGYCCLIEKFLSKAEAKHL